MFYFTYVLQSLRDNLHYIGHCKDLKERLGEHNSGKVISTRNRRPLELIYFEACKDLNSAIQREKYFKTGFGRRYLKNRLGGRSVKEQARPPSQA